MMLNNPSLSNTFRHANDENVIPNTMKQLSSSSSSLSKSKNGIALNPVMNGTMNAKPSSSLSSSGSSFPKTPSGGGKVGGGRRKALGDISNRKAGNNNGHKHNNILISSTKISKLTSGLSHINIHDDSKGSSGSGGNDGLMSLKKSTKKKKKNVTFHKQVYQDDENMKDSAIETKKMDSLQNTSITKRSMIYDESESCMSHNRSRINTSSMSSSVVLDDDDIDEVPMRIETSKSLDEKAVEDDDDLLRLDDDILNFDVTEYRRREEMDELEKMQRKLVEIEIRELQDLYKDDAEEVDTGFVEIFGDEVTDGLVPFVDDDESDHFDRSKYIIGLEDVSI